MIRTTLRFFAWSGCALLTVSQATAETPVRWDGSYLGVHVGYGRGTATPTLSGAPAPAGQPGFGSLSGGVFGGYNLQTDNGLVYGLEADVSFLDAQPGADGIWAGTSTRGIVTEALGGLGSLRARLGKAQGDWLFYVTGGFAAAISHTSRVSAPDADDNVARSHLRLGWTAGAGIEYAFATPWSLRAEVLYTRFGTSDVQPPGGPAYASRFDLWTARLGLAYRFTDMPGRATKSAAEPNGLDWELHGQSTYILQGYPAFRSPYWGANSLSPWPQAKSTWTNSVFLGVRVWDGGEIYYNPELLQGFGFNGTAGAGGFPNGEAQKSDFAYPRYNTSRLFLRQTFGFGGEQET
ncbi:MAG: outer membrane beta-barrel protein, partial [Pseudolabrys sp.]